MTSYSNLLTEENTKAANVADDTAISKALFTWVQASDSLEAQERTLWEGTYSLGLQQVHCSQDQNKRAIF